MPFDLEILYKEFILWVKYRTMQRSMYKDQCKMNKCDSL